MTASDLEFAARRVVDDGKGELQLTWKGKPLTDIIVGQSGELHLVTEEPKDTDPPER